MRCPSTTGFWPAARGGSCWPPFGRRMPWNGSGPAKRGADLSFTDWHSVSEIMRDGPPNPSDLFWARVLQLTANIWKRQPRRKQGSATLRPIKLAPATTAPAGPLCPVDGGAAVLCGGTRELSAPQHHSRDQDFLSTRSALSSTFFL